MKPENDSAAVLIDLDDLPELPPDPEMVKNMRWAVGQNPDGTVSLTMFSGGSIELTTADALLLAEMLLSARGQTR